MKTLCIIPMRSGSKGIRDKNIINLCGKPLFAWSVDQARNAQVNRIVISTDSKEYITNVNSRYPKDNYCPFVRPKGLAASTTPTNKVILHALNVILEQEKYDAFVLLEPTAPLRLTADITQCLAKIREGHKAVVSVCTNHRAHPAHCYRIKRNYLQPNTDLPHLQRQQLEPFYHLTGTVYAANVDWYLEHKTFISPETYAYIVQEWQDMEIDSPDDLIKIKPFMERVK